MPLELTGSMGFASPVFDFTCDFGLTFTIAGQVGFFTNMIANSVAL
jgi:hypothetical protein